MLGAGCQPQRVLARVVLGTLVAASLLLGSMVACAQDATAEAPGGREVRVVRPPEGSIRRGVLLVPAWTVYLVGGTLTVLAAGAVLARGRSRARTAGRSGGPP